MRKLFKLSAPTPIPTNAIIFTKLIGSPETFASQQYANKIGWPARLSKKSSLALDDPTSNNSQSSANRPLLTINGMWTTIRRKTKAVDWRNCDRSIDLAIHQPFVSHLQPNTGSYLPAITMATMGRFCCKSRRQTEIGRLGRWRPAMQAAAGSEQWLQEQTLPGRLAGRAA